MNEKELIWKSLKGEVKTVDLYKELDDRYNKWYNLAKQYMSDEKLLRIQNYQKQGDNYPFCSVDQIPAGKKRLINSQLDRYKNKYLKLKHLIYELREMIGDIDEFEYEFILQPIIFIKEE